MLHTKFLYDRAAGSGEEDSLTVFYQIWALRPAWSCNQNILQVFAPSSIEC